MLLWAEAKGVSSGVVFLNYTMGPPKTSNNYYSRSQKVGTWLARIPNTLPCDVPISTLMRGYPARRQGWSLQGMYSYSGKGTRNSESPAGNSSALQWNTNQKPSYEENQSS